MKVSVQIDPQCAQPEVIIRTDKMTEETAALVQLLSDPPHRMIAGFEKDAVRLLDTDEILRFYTANQKVFAHTAQGEYLVHMRLYELEERLDKATFVRISNSEIVNLKAIRSLDLHITGTICLSLSNHVVTYVSRRYVAKIKKALGIGR